MNIGNLEVVKAWVRGDRASSRNLHTDGRTLYSYMVAIAWKRDLVVAYNPKWYSCTTTRHLNAGLREARSYGFRVEPDEQGTVPEAQPAGTQLRLLA